MSFLFFWFMEQSLVHREETQRCWLDLQRRFSSLAQSIFSSRTSNEKMIMSSMLWRHKRHQFGFWWRARIFLCRTSINSVYASVNKRLRRIYIFWKILFPHLFKKIRMYSVELPWSMLRIALLTEALWKKAFELSFQEGRSWRLPLYAIESARLIVSHCWISKLRNDLLGWKSQSEVVEFQASSLTQLETN